MKPDVRNFEQLVAQLKSRLRMDYDAPDTYPHVSSSSFRVGEPDHIGRVCIEYTIRNLSGAEDSGSVIEETSQPGIWRFA